MAFYKLIRKSNWETVAFILINKLISPNLGTTFFRPQLMRHDSLDYAVKLLGALNHKKHPEHPEETLQRTIQNLRDKGYIEFSSSRPGEYRLTITGQEETKRVVSELKSIFTTQADS